jgi:hypothetical protein
MRVKRTYSSIYKSMVEMTKKGNKMLVESIDRINATNLVLEDKQIEYLKTINEAANNMQKDMVQDFNNMTPIMTMAFM